MSKPLLIALCLLSLPVLADEFKAAFVDLQRAVTEVDDGKAAKAHLQAMIEKKQKDFDKERTALQAEKAALDKQGPMMKPETLRAKEDALEKKVMDLAKRAEVSRAEVAKEERQALDGIFGRMQALLGEIAQREGLAMVFDRSSGVAWAQPSLDLTNELIRSYNSRFGGKSAKKGAPKK